ncbi:uncharacterized protein LOC133884045 [Phragmites australis]|uniref:uncharacterized protein LOC133884045 n=1 Tax=Phragmites australis TaxID=29695 RepID=UPI002D79429D|nr:uncharacterized protein LOC133884045 [Phragmites australis]
MKRDIYCKIVKEVEEHDPWFQQRRNAAGELGLSSLQKVTVAFRMLAYDAPADSLDECLRLGESTIIESMRRFVRAVVEVFGDEYIRAPNKEDTARLLDMNQRRGFPGCWEALTAYIGGSLNEINVLHRSHLLDNLAAGEAPKVQFSINEHYYTMGYYLADGIYTEWATFIKPIQSPVGRKRQHFVVQ